jgi:hypothetical protein
MVSFVRNRRGCVEAEIPVAAEKTFMIMGAIPELGNQFLDMRTFKARRVKVSDVWLVVILFEDNGHAEVIESATYDRLRFARRIVRD